MWETPASTAPVMCRIGARNAITGLSAKQIQVGEPVAGERPAPFGDRRVQFMIIQQQRLTRRRRVETDHVTSDDMVDAFSGWRSCRPD